jgi:hypothetical protein
VTNSFTITVNESNRPPVLTVPANQILTEETLLNVPASGTDPDLPANVLTFALVSPPAGMTIDTVSGAISWMPTEPLGSNTYVITVSVTDTNPTAINENSLSVTNTFSVTVNESNRPPVLTMPADQTITEETPLNVSASATDPDLAANGLTFALISPPAGLTIDSVSGVIAWTPDETQGPNSYTVEVTVTDDNPLAINDGHLTVTNSFTVTVNESNRPPELGALANYAVGAGQTIGFTATATDPDTPANALTFWLVRPPAGVSIDGSGQFSWRVPAVLASTTNVIQVAVTDNGTPNQSDTNSFTVIVNPLNPLTLSAMSYLGGHFTFKVSGSAGPDYVIMTSTNLVDWTDLATNAAPAPPFEYTDQNAGLLGGRSYKARLVP